MEGFYWFVCVCVVCYTFYRVVDRIAEHHERLNDHEAREREFFSKVLDGGRD